MDDQYIKTLYLFLDHLKHSAMETMKKDLILN